MSLENKDEQWIEVVVQSPVALAEGIANELVRSVACAQDGVQIRRDEVVFWVRFFLLEESLAEVRLCLTQLSKQGWNIDSKNVRVGAMAPEEEWRDAWKKHFHVTRLTRQIVVVPSWEDYIAQPDDKIIHLDPGQAFGTGAHASTQLVLQDLQDLADTASFQPPKSVFDLGTGSGILAIAATLFWPDTKITATDIDPLSISATKENTMRNQVAEKISVSTKDLADIQETFPLVLANIQAHILRELRDDLLPRLKPGGRLLVSGILSSQIQPLCDFYLESERINLVSIRESTLNPDWSSAHFQVQL